MKKVLGTALFVSMLAVCNSANAQYPNYGGYQPSAQQQQYQQQGTGKKKGKRNKGEQVQYQQVQQYQQYPQQPQQYQQAPQYQQYPQQPQQYQQAPQYQQYPQQPQQYQQAPQYQQYPQQPQQYQQAPQYQQYPQQAHPQYYQQAQSGFQYQQAPQQSQQYQQVPAQPATSADGFTEVVLSKIEQKALELNTGEIRAYGQAVSANEMLAIRLANAQATNALQAKVETYVRSGLDSYMDQTGVNGEYSIDEKLRDQIIVAAKGFITGVKEVDKAKAYNSQKKLWKYEICVSYDRAGLIEVMAAQSQRILKNEKQFEESMKHAWDALDAQNNRISLGEQQDMRKNDMQQGNLDKQHQRDMQKSAQQNQHDQQMNLQDNQYKLEREKVRANSPHAPQPEQKESQAPVQILNVH